VLPADVILNYNTIAGQTWADLVASHSDWNAVMSDFDYGTWGDVMADLPGLFVFTRPGP
jgi:hypothetical protein